jgi:hypothetical protein
VSLGFPGVVFIIPAIPKLRQNQVSNVKPPDHGLLNLWEGTRRTHISFSLNNCP